MEEKTPQQYLAELIAERDYFEKLASELMESKKQKDREIEELTGLNLWSARRLHSIYKKFAYDELEKITGKKHERI